MGSQTPTIVPTRPVSSVPSPNLSQGAFPAYPTPALVDKKETIHGPVRGASTESIGHRQATVDPLFTSHAHQRTHAHSHHHDHSQHNGHLPNPVSEPQPRRPFFKRISSMRERTHSNLTVHRDPRTYLPPILSRFLGWRPPHGKPPYEPLPFPPFSWFKHIPLKYEVWILSTFGAFVGIAMIEIVMGTAFADKGVPLIVGSFGASAVLTFGALDSPLAQPRHLVGGHVLCSIVGVALTRLFRHASAYELTDTTVVGELRHVVWLNGALAMALSLLVMQVTKTVHPPAGATALIAAVQPSAVHLSWRYIYLVLISSLLMLGWGMIINNVGRRRYPTYWISGERVYVRDPQAGITRVITQDDLRMAAVEGRSDGFDVMDRVMSRSEPDEEDLNSPPGTLGDVSAASSLDTWHEKKAPRSRDVSMV